MKVKIIYLNDIRIWRYPTTLRYLSLLSFVCTSFKTLNSQQQQSFNLQYEDEDRDWINITCDEDFDDALDCAINEKRKSLKIFVIKTSNVSTSNNSDIINFADIIATINETTEPTKLSSSENVISKIDENMHILMVDDEIIHDRCVSVRVE